LKDYVDDAEPLWQHFCLIHFKDAQRDEFETYYELYQVIQIQKQNEYAYSLEYYSEKSMKKKNDYEE
jgi:hypothetical protein